MTIITFQIPDSVLIEAYGVETIEQVRAIQKKEREAWCDDPKHEDVYYVPDNKRRDVRKHHYRCTSCDKIKQIG
jgi:hypothetical protein